MGHQGEAEGAGCCQSWEEAEVGVEEGHHHREVLLE